MLALNGYVHYRIRSHRRPVVGSSCRTLGRIFVSKEQMWTRNNTTSYVPIGDNYLPEGQIMPLAVTFHSKKPPVVHSMHKHVSESIKQGRGCAVIQH